MKNLSRVVLCVIIVTAMVAMTSNSAAAGDYLDRSQDRAASPCEVQSSRYVDHRWFFQISPYLWAPGVSGDMGFNGQSVDLNANTANMLENFDLAAGLSAEVGWCRISFLADVFYFDMTSDQVEVNDGGEPEIDLRNIVTTAAMSWAMRPHANVKLGPVAGVRYVHARPEARLADDDAQFSFGTSQGWFDPIIGLRGRADIVDPVYIPFYADVGGLGFGSELTWQAYGALGVELGDKIGLELGYRHFYVDRVSDELEYRIHTGGPLFKATFGW